jgi:ADP-heptose:LPS heptosyltransferase
MLTAAVRDLHYWYPGRFATDVRTPFPALWMNNPHLTVFTERQKDIECIECTYPLIDRCNQTPYHCLHGFIEFLNDRLGLAMRPTTFKGDIHLSEQEKAWYSQVREVTNQDIPYWLVVAGGKYDVTIKWWDSKRYQDVVNHFHGRIQFVQVGEHGHHHPKLNGAIDLRGRTNIRELIRLVHHSQGVLCPVTGLMHLAAAVESRPGSPARRPCVVIAGGREPAHWEAYPDHQFIHTNGALRCCAAGGCWKDRVSRLRDGDERDRPGSLCVDVINGLPHCMDMISAAEVIHRIERYFAAGTLKYLSARQKTFADRGVAATTKNACDDQSLNLSSAGSACDRFTETIPPYPGTFKGRGIVICGGGVRYFTNAWACINLLRHFGCRLPIQLWHLGPNEVDQQMRSLLAPLGVECVDALRMRKRFPARILNGWELKPYAILHSRYRELLLLDADNMPVANPDYLFESPQFTECGAIFWPDFPLARTKRGTAIWRSCGLRQPDEPEFETGQIVVDKQRCWSALCLTMWFNENSDFYYRYIHGDKETFHLAWRKLRRPYALVPKSVHSLAGIMCQHDFRGKRIFQHRSRDKWDLFLINKRIRGFRFEKECRNYILRLQRLWDGGMGLTRKSATGNWPRPMKVSRPIKIGALVTPRGKAREEHGSLQENLAHTDWANIIAGTQAQEPDEFKSPTEQEQCFRLAIGWSLSAGVDYVLLVKRNTEFNRHIRHNLLNWKPLHSGLVSLASLYNPRHTETRDLACDLENHARIVDPHSTSTSPAWLISRSAAQYLLQHWNRIGGGLDVKLRLMAIQLRRPIFYHAPSLAQPLMGNNESPKSLSSAKDFDPNWLA